MGKQREHKWDTMESLRMKRDMRETYYSIISNNKQEIPYRVINKQGLNKFKWEKIKNTIKDKKQINEFSHKHILLPKP